MVFAHNNKDMKIRNNDLSCRSIDVDIEGWVRCMVSDEIQRHGDYSMLRNLCREAIKEEISNVLSIDISLKRKGDKIMLNEQEP